MALRVEGFAIVSDDGMLADARGAMPPELVIKSDQDFLSDGLDRAAVIVHGRNSHENQPQSPRRKRLIATRMIESIAPAPGYPEALWWNPAGFPFEQAAEMLGAWQGTVAILGGTEIFGLFLPRYDTFYLSHAAGVRLPSGRPVFPRVPDIGPEAALASNGLTLTSRQTLDATRGVSLSTWVRNPTQG